MALCPSCGKNIDDSCSFCSACGAKVENNIVQNGAYNVSTREGTMALMNDVQKLYHSFSDKFSTIVALKTENEKLRKYRSKPCTVFLILAIAFTVISLIGLAAGGIPQGCLIVFLAYAVPFYVLFVVFNIKDKKNRVNNQVKIQENDKIIDGIAHEIAEEYFQNDISEYYAFDYFYEDAIDTLIRYLSQFRADSLKDALNLFETEAHQRRLEDQQKSIIITQKEILNQAKQTAKAATASAVFSGISAYNSTKIKQNVDEINSKL